MKKFLIDFKKHFNQAFATLAAGIIIGWLFGGAKVISQQKEQSRSLDSLTATVNSLSAQEDQFYILNQKVDEVLLQNIEIKEYFILSTERAAVIAKELLTTQEAVKETNKRLFDILKK